VIDALRVVGKDVVLGLDWVRRKLTKDEKTDVVYPSLSIVWSTRTKRSSSSTTGQRTRHTA